MSEQAVPDPLPEGASDEHKRGSGSGRLRGLGADIGAKLFLTLVAAGISALLIPWITGKWQDHKQQLELRTSLATEMSNAYTNAIVSGRFVTKGMVYSGSVSPTENTAVTHNAWTGALHDWLVKSGTIAAELTGRYGASGIASEWSTYANAVTDYIWLGAVVSPDQRKQLLTDESARVRDSRMHWQSLARPKNFKNDPAFLNAYTELGDWLLGRGSALVLKELRLSPHV